MVSQHEYKQFVKNLEKEALSSSLLEEPSRKRSRKILKKCKLTVLQILKRSVKARKSTSGQLPQFPVPRVPVYCRPAVQPAVQNDLQSRRTSNQATIRPHRGHLQSQVGVQIVTQRPVIPTIFVQENQIYVRKRPFNPDQQFEVLYMC